jgi:hypothetical protein
MIKLYGVGAWKGVKRVAIGFALVSLIMAKASIALAITAAPLKLAWDASPNTVAGYKVYYTVAGSSTNSSVNTGQATVATLSSLTAGATYFIYVVAYDSAGNESPRSNVITYSPPAVSKIALSKPSANSAQLQFRAAAGSQCRIEYTSSLSPAQWQPLTMATADTNGTITVTDPLTGRPPTRFYRAVRL